MNDALRAARAARGLPDYDRKPPPEPKPEPPKRGGPLVTCAKCEERFTADSFKAAGSAYKMNVCDACFQEAYPKRKVPCSVCSRIISTRGKSDHPTCRPCRAARPTPEKPSVLPADPHCAGCFEEVTGRQTTRGLCAACYLRTWRASHGINSRQRIGEGTQERKAA